MTDKVKLEKILNWLADKKAADISVYEVAAVSTYTDFIVVCSGSADMHNRAIAQHLLDMAKEQDLVVISKEGLEFGSWILVDLGDVIVHVFMPEKREYYKIDELFQSLSRAIPEAGKI